MSFSQKKNAKSDICVKLDNRNSKCVKSLGLLMHVNLNWYKFIDSYKSKILSGRFY